MNILIEVRQVYGNTLYYPACEKAKAFCQLTNAKTLSQSAIAIIRRLGYDIEVVTPKL